jgi:3-oxoacyl-[acyl-carrier-protein] synthase-3
VSGLAFALGGASPTVEESCEAKRLLSTAADLASAGFVRHHICLPEETSYELACAAVRKMPMPDSVDAIIYSTCLPENANAGEPGAWRSSKDVKHLMDYPASRLQADFGLDSAAVFGLGQQGCTGMLGSLRLAGALLAYEPQWHNVLCVTADRFPEGALYEQSYNVISDGAAACVVSAKEAGEAQRGELRLLASHQITNGGLHAASDDETVGVFFSYVPRLVRQTLERAGLTVADIDWVIPQNTNRSAWEVAARLLGIDHGRVWQSTLAETGHVTSADNLINLAALLDAGLVRPGQRLLLVMAGHGLNWQATILEATQDAAWRN